MDWSLLWSGVFISYLAGGIFISFFVSLAIAYVFSDNKRVRKYFTIGLICVVFLSSVLAIEMLPFIHMQKFSQPEQQTETFHMMYVADENDTELYLDSRAVPPFLNVHIRQEAKNMVYDYGSGETVELSCFFINQANSYRNQILSGNHQGSHLSFPTHKFEKHWTVNDVESVSEFTELRVYEIMIKTSEDGTKVVERSDHRLYTFDATEHVSCEGQL
ncbi:MULTISPECIES: hypothetical protein [Natrialbaceae]|uniref:hypothetical protein n=1 Tax=Natrialbaceae TaxID=1644061 RepID=UPI00207D6A86|nr:hypothetical protein [Natronococcus sp. CG52]